MRTDMSIEEERIVLDWIDRQQPAPKGRGQVRGHGYLDIKDKLMGSMEPVQNILFKALVSGEK
eukprot:16357458-Heterocapsa_arctica.AAC.1